MRNPFSLSDKKILVVGASSGIGQAIAVECSNMGAQLIIAARSQDGLNETINQLNGVGHQSVVVDVTDEIHLKALVNAVPSIDGLVLCAGKGLTLPIPFCSREKFDEIFNINFFAQCELVRLLNKKKKIASGGSIVLLSSIGGVTVHSVGASIYGSSKAALNSFMRYCAVEFAPRKIRVNSINPGMVKTKFIERGTLTAEDFAKDVEHYLLKRYGHPCEIAHGAIYLLSDAASWVTGHSLVIDGGRSVN